ncbi:MAG: hypothetical protein ACK56I_24140, partial [bacterium]
LSRHVQPLESVDAMLELQCRHFQSAGRFSLFKLFCGLLQRGARVFMSGLRTWVLPVADRAVSVHELHCWNLFVRCCFGMLRLPTRKLLMGPTGARQRCPLMQPMSARQVLATQCYRKLFPLPFGLFWACVDDV